MISRTGRYKVFPVAGLALMTVGLLLLAQMGAGTVAGDGGAAARRVRRSASGWSRRSLTVALQNAVERRDLGIATASANLVRALGGSVGVALFGALFADGLGGTAGLDPAATADALQTVFLVAARRSPAAGMLVDAAAARGAAARRRARRGRGR